jgi:hypothetical protein
LQFGVYLDAVFNHVVVVSFAVDISTNNFNTNKENDIELSEMCAYGRHGQEFALDASGLIQTDWTLAQNQFT